MATQATSFIGQPMPRDARSAEVALERLDEAMEAAPDAPEGLKHALTQEERRVFLRGVLSGSPFLMRLALTHLNALHIALTQEPELALATVMGEGKQAVQSADEEAQVMRALREARAAAALIIGLADLSGRWDVWEVTRRLTDFADDCVGLALDYLTRMAAKRGELDEGEGDLTRGLIILGMGKYGAHELNYSSDIDLIVLYDAERVPIKDGKDLSSVYVRITRDLVRFMQEMTEDGYVFRTDLRLRPDGNASPVALSTDAALSYYEAAGQNWERAAMIKARPIAGDIEAGEAFLAELVPFVWRKHLDFAAIADIHSIKRQIHTHKGHGAVTVAGHNLKLGRGGIREIEFFAQTQQLIVGGRDAEFRVRRTDEALKALTDKGMVSEEVRDELLNAYVFLRTAEHRLQMVDDQQTHSLPKSDEELTAIAHFCGYAETNDFVEATRQVLECVQGHYSQLFETEESLAVETGNLVFTGVEDDPDTLDTIAGLGFEEPGKVSATLRAWHRGRIRATRNAKARELLTRLTPKLLSAFGSSAEADRTFREFVRFVEALPSGIQIFSLLASNVWLLEELAELFSLAPHMASVLSEAPGTLDGLLDPDFRGYAPSLEELQDDLRLALDRYDYLEAKLDAARIFARENRLRVAIQLLGGTLDAVGAGRAYSLTAVTAVEGLSHLAIEQVAERHGHVPGAEWAVVGMGKLGGGELTATSDLDLIFVYDFPEGQEVSDGEHPLPVSQYFARVGQKLISLLTVPTSEGVLYEVDMRLRPSGRAGPIAVTLERFRSYHSEQAWTWEHMALSRAQVIAGPAGLRDRIEQEIRGRLTAERDLSKLKTDVMDMRQKLIDAKGTKDPWTLKHVRGGLIDTEFLVQTLQLAHAHENSEVLSPNTLDAITALKDGGYITAEDCQALTGAYKILQSLSHILRICLGAEGPPHDAPDGLKARLMRLTNANDMEAVEKALLSAEATVLSAYTKYVEGLEA